MTLVAASKRQADDRIEAALEAGQRVFGENRVQEAQGRWVPRRADYDDLQLRLIGPLQTNKAEDAVALFDVIETLDREKLLKALIKAVEKTGAAAPDVLIQVNTGDEPQKGGVSLEGLADLLAAARETYPGQVRGLMCIPPADEPAAPHFALLKKLADQHQLPKVSMGMSGDYALAARLGATHVRVGTALFGARDY
ncbi:MAG: YggS family pyridoxal phosphate-dependent enzyme [Henriciella sp.]